MRAFACFCVAGLLVFVVALGAMSGGDKQAPVANPVVQIDNVARTDKGVAGLFVYIDVCPDHDNIGPTAAYGDLLFFLTSYRMERQSQVDDAEREIRRTIQGEAATEFFCVALRPRFLNAVRGGHL